VCCREPYQRQPSCVAVCCSVLQCVAESLIKDSHLVLQCVVVCCSALQRALSKTAIFPEKDKETCTFPMNLHKVGRSARPTSRWSPKAHHVMGKTHKRHCERSFGTHELIRQITRQIHLALYSPSSTREWAWINVETKHLLNLKLCSRTRPCHERDHFSEQDLSEQDRSLKMGFSLHSPVCHDSVTCVPWLIHKCAMTHTNLCHDSYKCVPWLIHGTHVNESWYTHE